MSLIPARRPIAEHDLEFLCQLYASTRQEEMSRSGWPEEVQADFLRQQFWMQHRYYQQYFVGGEFELLLDGAGEPIGRLYTYLYPDSLCIVDIALLPEWRGHGIGTFLLNEQLARADALGLPVTLHVEYYNRAREWYRRLGFSERGENGVYYCMVREPALVAA
ncbi:GNAT family N-acetyltransferase [Chitinimonas lacunae]|uniref:GNAT family N-acetyltransferase n=1 Tax=Chitinimonas lacunae TaxID=1963018 RepID=A0ABV8MS76_9NEIS